MKCSFPDESMIRRWSIDSARVLKNNLSIVINNALGGFWNPTMSSFLSNCEDAQMEEFLYYMEKLKNYEKLGVPRDAGTDSGDGFDLSRMKRLLKSLGNPQSKFKAVHIAGTKGKGSVASFISSILRKQGYSVGCYTSPHLQTIRERMSTGSTGEAIAATTLNRLFLNHRHIIDQAIQFEKGALTHFEVLTALAFTLFAQENVDIAVVEAGLGGARDATNSLCSISVACSVVTNIGEEHLSALGGSLESIAVAKSGIFRHACPIVLGGPFLPHIEHILREKAAAMTAPVILASDLGKRSTLKHFITKEETTYQLCDVVMTDKSERMFMKFFDVKLRMLGHHQLQNAVTATCVALCLRTHGWKISDEAIQAGLEDAYLIGRCQFLTNKETESLGLTKCSVLIDGAHTDAAAAALAELIMSTKPVQPSALIISMASDKNHSAFAQKLLSGTKPEIVVLTQVDIAGGKSRLTEAPKLKEAWIEAAKKLDMGFEDFGIVRHESDDLPLHYQKNAMVMVAADTTDIRVPLKVADGLLSSKMEGHGQIIVTGSLHIVAAVLDCIDRESTER